MLVLPLRFMLNPAFVPFNVSWLPGCPEKRKKKCFVQKLLNITVHPKQYTKSSDLGTLTAVNEYKSYYLRVVYLKT